MSREISERVSDSLRGRFGDLSRRWKGDSASYAAKHMWISKHFGKASACENDLKHTSSRFEWANISGEYKRERNDYKQLCKRCHVEFDRKNTCRRGHWLTAGTFRVTREGWRVCKECHAIQQRNYIERKGLCQNA